MYYKFLIFSTLCFFGCKFKQVYRQPTDNTPISENIGVDKEIENIIMPYKEGLSEAMDEVIGFSPAFLEKKKPHSILGSFMAEAVYQAATKASDKPIDFCLLNYGGIRSTLDSGDITIGDIYQIMPFENEITILTLDKAQMDTVFALIEKKGGEPFISHEWEDKSAYQVMNQNVFRLATNDYIANGGDNYDILTRALKRENTGIKIRDGLITFVQENNPLPLVYEKTKK